MNANTRRYLLQGVTIGACALVVSSIGGWPRRATADEEVTPAPVVLGDLRELSRQLETARGELAVARLQLERADAVIDFSTRYGIPADLAGAIYDIALAEGVEPSLAFRLVKVESGFDPRAKSSVGALGLTQVLPSTARLYEPGLAPSQLFDRDTNLRLGLRYLRDLLERYDGNLERALLAYNRGPGRLQEMLEAGLASGDRYTRRVMGKSR